MSDQTAATRTRFAPSPTGALHLGNARTALFNALIARRAGGRFLLRFDDTDVARVEARYYEGIRRDLEWLGLGWDDEARQSDRAEAYAAAADRLRAAGRLYPCWETQEELALRRRAALNAGRPPVYDRRALALTEAEKAALSAERPAHWRFLLDRAPIEWEDGVRGPQRIDAGAVSDPVLIRADGQVLYSLSSVVDDAEFGITDIVRGADHVTNSAAQLQIFDALGAQRPRLAHHSLMTDEEGAKLSKRAGGSGLADLREAGIEAAAVVAYLARIGSSHPVEAERDLDAVAAGFDLTAFGQAPTRISVAEIAQLSARMLREAPFEAVAARAPEGLTRDLWRVIRPNLDRLEDAAYWIALTRGEAEIAPPEAEDAAFVAEALALMPPGPWDETTWKSWTGDVKTATGRKGRALFQPLRRALTGRDHGPDMGELMPLLPARR